MTYISFGQCITLGCVCLGLLIAPATLQLSQVQAAPQRSAAEQAEIRTLLKELRINRNQYVRAKAAKELGLIGATEALEQLHESLITDLSTQVRINSAAAIARINQKSSAKRLLQALVVNRGRTDVQIAIVSALGDMRQNARDLVPAILQLLRSPSPFIREAAVEALWKIGDRRVSKYLVRLLKNETEIVVKLTLCAVLPDFRDPTAMPILDKLARKADEPADVRGQAREAYEKMEEMGLTPSSAL